MREILFKAKRLSDGAWVDGYLYRLHESVNPFIMLRNRHGEAYEVDPSTVCEYTNIDIRREAWPSSEVHKIFTGDILGERDEDGNECGCILGVVAYLENEGRYVLKDEYGLCSDWTLEGEAQPVNWPKLIHCGSIHDGEDRQ